MNCGETSSGNQEETCAKKNSGARKKFMLSREDRGAEGSESAQEHDVDQARQNLY